jgi:hypothetical protein
MGQADRVEFSRLVFKRNAVAKIDLGVLSNFFAEMVR